MEAGRVDYTLKSPMAVSDRTITLDGLLEYCAYQMALRAKHPDPIEASHDIPLERQYASGGKEPSVWKASQFLIESEGGIFWHHYTRRFEPQQWAEDFGKGLWKEKISDKFAFNVATGHFKGYSFNQALLTVKKATAWFVGDLDIVEAMLTQEVDCLGRNGRIGLGRVDTLKVSPASPEEVDYWRRRALPLELNHLALPEHFHGHGATQPPYWKRENWKPILEYDMPSVPAVPSELAAA